MVISNKTRQTVFFFFCAFDQAITGAIYFTFHNGKKSSFDRPNYISIQAFHFKISVKKKRRKEIPEDRDKVWSVGGKVKESMTHADIYITQDYARAIQEERRVFIKAMMKAREEHGLNDAKVKGRFLFIKN